MSLLLLSSGSAVGISSAAAFAFSRGTCPGGEAVAPCPGGPVGGASVHVGEEQPASLSMSCGLWDTMGLAPQESSRDSRQQNGVTPVSG